MLQFYRHGDRMPIYTYVNDPYKNNSYWPAPWGELSDVSLYNILKKNFFYYVKILCVTSHVFVFITKK